MANITPYITAIRTARYGEQVRGSIADALEVVNDQVEDDTSSAGASATSAANSATSAANAQAAAQSIADDLVDDLADLHQTQAELAVAEAQREQAEQARVVAEQARADQATGYVAQARNYANQAQRYASSDNALLSQSWAVGGTSSRYGEDTNNSKYWAEVAAQVVTEGGVASFNGRTGNVSPMSGDYNAEQITYGSSTVKSAMDGFTSAVDEIIDANLLVADDDATPTGEVDFTSADTTLTPATSESVELLSGSDGWSTRLYKISQMFKNIRYLLSKVNSMGVVYEYGLNGTFSLPSNTNEPSSLIEATFPSRGTFLVIAKATFPANSNGSRSCGWASGSTTTFIVQRATTVKAADGISTILQATSAIAVDSDNMAVRVLARQNSGTTLTIQYASLMLVKLK